MGSKEVKNSQKKNCPFFLLGAFHKLRLHFLEFFDHVRPQFALFMQQTIRFSDHLPNLSANVICERPLIISRKGADKNWARFQKRKQFENQSIQKISCQVLNNFCRFETPYGEKMTIFTRCTVSFWCQAKHKKFLQRFDTIFGLKW